MMENIASTLDHSRWNDSRTINNNSPDRYFNSSSSVHDGVSLVVNSSSSSAAWAAAASISSSSSTSILLSPDAGGISADELVGSSIDLTVIEIILYVILAIACVACNAVVLAVILNRRTFHSPTNGFISSLCVSNLLLGILVLPGIILVDTLPPSHHSGYSHGSPLPSAWSTTSSAAEAVGCETIVFLTLWFSIKNVLTSMMIALDRWYAIAKPMQYPNRVTQKRSLIVLAGIWIVSMVPAVLTPCVKHMVIHSRSSSTGPRNESSIPLAHGTTRFPPSHNYLYTAPSSSLTFLDADESRHQHQHPAAAAAAAYHSDQMCFWNWSEVPVAAAIICLVFVVLPFVVMSVAYWSLYRMAVKHAKQIRKDSRLGVLSAGLTGHVDGQNHHERLLQLGPDDDDNRGHHLCGSSIGIERKTPIPLVHSAPNLRRLMDYSATPPASTPPTPPNGPFLSTTTTTTPTTMTTTEPPTTCQLHQPALINEAVMSMTQADKSKPYPAPAAATVMTKPTRPNQLLVYSCARRNIMTVRELIDLKKMPHLPLGDKLSPVSLGCMLPPISASCPASPMTSPTNHMDNRGLDEQPAELVINDSFNGFAVLENPLAGSLKSVNSSKGSSISSATRGIMKGGHQQKTTSRSMTPDMAARRLVIKRNLNSPELWVTGPSVRRKQDNKTHNIVNNENEGIQMKELPFNNCQQPHDEAQHNTDEALEIPLVIVKEELDPNPLPACTCFLTRHSYPSTEADRLTPLMGIPPANNNNNGRKSCYSGKSVRLDCSGKRLLNGTNRSAVSSSHIERKIRARGLPRRASALSMDLANAGANLVRRISSSMHFKRPLSLSVGWLFPYRSPSKALRTILLILGGLAVTWGPTLSLIFYEACGSIRGTPAELLTTSNETLTAQLEDYINIAAAADLSDNVINVTDDEDKNEDDYVTSNDSGQDDEGWMQFTAKNFTPLMPDQSAEEFSSSSSSSSTSSAYREATRRLARFFFYLNTLYHPLVYGFYPKVIRAGIVTLLFRTWRRVRASCNRLPSAASAAAASVTQWCCWVCYCCCFSRGSVGGVHRHQQQQQKMRQASSDVAGGAGDGNSTKQQQPNRTNRLHQLRSNDRRGGATFTVGVEGTSVDVCPARVLRLETSA